MTAILGLAAVTENRSQAPEGGLYNAGAAAVVRLTGQAAVAAIGLGATAAASATGRAAPSLWLRRPP